MINLKLELFNFKKELDYETQSDISQIVESHYSVCDFQSEKNIIVSLNNRLDQFSYDPDVKELLENLNMDLKANDLMYTLKDLFKIIESKNQGMIYRQTLNVLLEIINTDDDGDKMNKILNELALHDWVPEVKIFLHNMHSSPEDKTNLLSGGKSTSVYTVVESVKDGHVALIKDCWFLLSEDKVEKTLLENHIEDEAQIALLRTLQQALVYAEISETRIDFKIDENIVVGLSVDNPGETWINEDKLNDETSIANLFNSPIVPIAKKSFFPILKTVSENMDKIIELDVVKHVTNIGNPFVESFAFNFGKDIYLYRCDARQGSSFFKYESATELINDIKNELQFDLSYFFENRLDEETISSRQLEDKIREIQIDLDEIDTNADKVEANLKMMGESEQLSAALELLKNKKAEKENELSAIKEVRLTTKEKSLS